MTLEPALWLLEQGNDGIGLTQTGALNRALVREVAERWPSWWEADLFGPPHREDDETRSGAGGRTTGPARGARHGVASRRKFLRGLR